MCKKNSGKKASFRLYAVSRRKGHSGVFKGESEISAVSSHATTQTIPYIKKISLNLLC